MMGEAEVGTSEREAGGCVFCVSGGTASDLSTDPCHGDAVLGWGEK